MMPNRDASRAMTCRGRAPSVEQCRLASHVRVSWPHLASIRCSPNTSYHDSFHHHRHWRVALHGRFRKTLADLCVQMWSIRTTMPRALAERDQRFLFAMRKSDDIFRDNRDRR